jgi:hypothetical protein
MNKGETMDEYCLPSDQDQLNERRQAIPWDPRLAMKL